MNPTEQYKSRLSTAVKNLITFGNVEDAEGKTIIISTYDEDDKLPSETLLLGDPETLSYLILSMMQNMPTEEHIRMLAMIVDKQEEVLLDLMELKENGELGDIDLD